MNVLHCVRWMVDVWNLYMKDLAIANCFRKSSVKPQLNADVIAKILAIEDDTFYYDDMAERINIERGMQRLQEYGIILEAMELNLFLNPVEEPNRLR